MKKYDTVEQEYEKLGYAKEEYEEEEKDYLSYKVVKFTRLEGTVLATVVFTRAYDNKTSREHKTVKSYFDYYDPDHKLPISLDEEELALQIRALNELEYFQPKGVTPYFVS